MKYKGYVGKVDFDESARIFHGEIVNTKDVITFQGDTVGDLETAFKDSVDDYLSWCAEEGEYPEKPYSGKFNLRLPQELHREVALAAKRLNMSINTFVERALEDSIKKLQY